MEASPLVVPAAMGVALLVDAVWGEPPPALHPVVWMGRFLAGWGRRLPDRGPPGAFIGGAVGWVVGAAVCSGVGGAVGWAVTWATAWAPTTAWLRAALAALMYGIVLKPLLAWRLLRSEVLAVEAALGASLDDGRTRVARICSRDTRSLTAERVRETAIESLAENLNDSVIAPLFWFAVAGLPGAALYRFANTADAMWGYRERWEWAGKWAARADDVLSWLPARLTAVALVPPRLWRRLRLEARRTPSPNSGWPMGAMALRLDVQLGKPGMYVLNPQGRHASDADTARAARIAAVAIALLLVPMIALSLLMQRLA
jgi:adenosylcobinamide-phosphate synthase